MKKSKQAYYNKYFETKWNNIKNTWKGIRFLIFRKTIQGVISVNFYSTWHRDSGAQIQ